VSRSRRPHARRGSTTRVIRAPPTIRRRHAPSTSRSRRRAATGTAWRLAATTGAIANASTRWGQSDTGKAITEQKAVFEFDQGGGSATGAEYDPGTRELTLKANVVLDWRGKNPASPPMHAEAGEAKYIERESKVILYPWSKLTRDTLHMEAATSVVELEEGRVKKAEVQTARGVKDDPGRKVEFAADQLFLDFSDHMQIQKMSGHNNTKLVSTARTAKTTVTSDHVDLDFAVTAKDSTLANAVATGKSVAQSDPVTTPGTLLPWVME
jgi:hypothetical protein